MKFLRLLATLYTGAYAARELVANVSCSQEYNTPDSDHEMCVQILAYTGTDLSAANGEACFEYCENAPQFNRTVNAVVFSPSDRGCCCYHQCYCTEDDDTRHAVYADESYIDNAVAAPGECPYEPIGQDDGTGTDICSRTWRKVERCVANCDDCADDDDGEDADYDDNRNHCQELTTELECEKLLEGEWGWPKSMISECKAEAIDYVVCALDYTCRGKYDKGPYCAHSAAPTAHGRRLGFAAVASFAIAALLRA